MMRMQGTIRPWTLICGLALISIPRMANADVPFSIYGDVDFKYKNDDGNTTSFSAPRLELFYSGNWDRLSFLSEVMFEAGEDNEYSLDIERVQLSYSFADWLRVAAGRFHTAIGYYNDAYHHGYYFVLPTERPTAVDFEDSGGLIPAHSVGLHVDGRVHLQPELALRYDADLANGRGAPGEVTNKFARKMLKAVNLRLRLELGGALEGVQIGANIYVDKIPTNAGDPTTGQDNIPFAMSETILGAHLAYFEHNVHLISEYMWIRHHEEDGGTHTYNTQAFFAETGYTLRDVWTPYVRYEYTHFGLALDPFYAFNAASRGSFHRGTVGLRYLASEHIAFKLEGSAQRFVDPIAANAADVYVLSTQCAYAF